MRRAQQRRLKGRFPLVFRKPTPDKHQGGPPLRERTIECGPGWYALVAQFARTLERQLQRLPAQDQDGVYCVQVKETFSSLRIYMSSKISAVAATIERAVQKSFRICEDCKRSGKVRNRHAWLTILCASHVKGRFALSDADGRRRDFWDAMLSAATSPRSRRRGK